MTQDASTSQHPDVCVVGAGIAGLSAAWLLAEQGWPVQIVDAAPQAGGLLAPIPFVGGEFDRGSHRIHPESHPLLREITREETWLERPRKGRLVLGGRTMVYPPKMGDFLRGLGGKTVAHMGINFLTRPNALSGFTRWESDRQDVEQDIGFADFVVRRVGRRAYQQFYAPYVEKVWGLDPNEISQTVAKARISTASPWVTLSKAIRSGPVPDRVFLYPAGGMEALIRNLQEKLRSKGVEIQYNTHFSASDAAAHTGPVLFSGHLSHLIDDLDLEHRGLYLLHISVPAGTIGETDTFYLPEKQFWFGRVSQPAQFDNGLEIEAQDVICVEIPEGRWGTEHDFLGSMDVIRAQLVEAGILAQDTPILDALQTFVPRVYPMYRRGWTERWQVALSRVAELGNVFPVGRQGLFLHCNIDQCVHISDVAVRHIMSGGSALDWTRRCPEFLDLRVRD